ncbi:hypothetical protein C1X66_10825 [Pseudomonas sp. MPR-R3B]|nr:hypothetical protein C1X66_10825 [Pseudomonas sp. MPR-R3B]
MSLPAPPLMVSRPAPPLSTLLPLLPVSTLFRALPTPLRLSLPVRVRFSRLAPRVQLTEERTVSISLARVLVSATTSLRLSTT